MFILYSILALTDGDCDGQAHSIHPQLFLIFLALPQKQESSK